MPDMNRRPSRQKVSFTKIPTWGIVLVAAMLLVSWFFNSLFSGPKQGGETLQLNEQAVLKAQEAVRQKLGDSLTITFPAKPQVEKTDPAQFTVRSQAVTTTRSGDQRKRSWIVALQYKEKSGPDVQKWEVLSCDIGQ